MSQEEGAGCDKPTPTPPPPPPPLTPSLQQHAPPPPNAPRAERIGRAQRKLSMGKGTYKDRADRACRKRCRAQKAKKERTKGKESLWLLEAPFRKIILQMHTPARTSQCWSRQTQHGLGVCTWMHLVNSTGNSPSPGQPTLE